MAKNRVKSWIASEILTAADLNAEFDALLSSPMNLISPATAAFNMAGYELILDAGGVSSITVDTTDVLHMKLQSIDAFIFDGDVVSPVNGLTFTSSATGTPVSITSQGTDADIDIDIIGKGAADLTVNLGGFDALIVNGSTASLLNGLTITSTATGVAPQITGHGQTDVSINLVPKGAGTIQIDGGVLAGKCINGSVAWDPANLGTGLSIQKAVTVTGAVLGDFCLPSFSLDVAGLSIIGYVSAADTAIVGLINNTGGDVNLGSGTAYARILSRT